MTTLQRASSTQQPRDRQGNRPRVQRPATPAQQLRALAGMGTRDFAAQAGLHEDELRAVEGGGADEATRRRLWLGLGLDPDAAEQGYLSRGAEPRLFSLVGEESTLHMSDLGTLLEALRRARRCSAASSSALRRRLLPQPLPGHLLPYQHGYALARRLRRELGLGAAPLDETFVGLLSHRLGLPVLRIRLSPGAPAALGLIDRDRRAGVILLCAPSALRADELFRIAHELCHLLFDPLEAGRLQLSLDGPRQGRGVGDGPPLEARANAFAAELLLPLEGLQELFGEPEATANSEEGRERLQRAVERFGAPSLCALWHLRNRGYIAGWVRDLLAASRDLPRPPPSGRLVLRVMEEEVRPAQDDVSLAEEAQRAEQSRGQTMVEDCVHQALQSAEAGKERLAGLILSRLADELQWAGQGEPLERLHEEVHRVLARRYPDVAAAQLVNTRSQPWPSQAREALLQSTLQVWRTEGCSESELQGMERQLALTTRIPSP